MPDQGSPLVSDPGPTSGTPQAEDRRSDSRCETSVRRPHAVVGAQPRPQATMSASAAIRKPMFPALLSGEFALRAAQR